MNYIKVTKKNADTLLVDGAEIWHLDRIVEENELESVNKSAIGTVARRLSSVILLDMPNAAKDLPHTPAYPGYEIDFFTDGYWWVKYN